MIFKTSLGLSRREGFITPPSTGDGIQKWLFYNSSGSVKGRYTQIQWTLNSHLIQFHKFQFIKHSDIGHRKEQSAQILSLGSNLYLSDCWNILSATQVNHFVVILPPGCQYPTNFPEYTSHSCHKNLLGWPCNKHFARLGK